MARATFGGTAADTVARRVKVLGHDVDDYEAATLTVWSAQTGGTQYTDLLVNGAASNSVPVDSTGQVPEFQGPDGVMVVWVSAGGARVKMLPAEGPTDTSVAGYVNDSASSTRAAVNGAVGHGLTSANAPKRAGYDSPGAGGDAALSVDGALSVLAPGPLDHRLWSDSSGNNVVSVRNKAVASDSAVKFLDSNGLERGAIGYHNRFDASPPTAPAFLDATFIESSRYIHIDGTSESTADGVTPLQPLRLITTGQIAPTMGWGAYCRLAMENTGDTFLLYPDMSFAPDGNAKAIKVRYDWSGVEVEPKLRVGRYASHTYDAPQATLDVRGKVVVGTSDNDRSGELGSGHALNLIQADGNMIRMLHEGVQKADIYLQPGRMEFVDPDHSSKVPLTLKFDGSANVLIGAADGGSGGPYGNGAGVLALTNATTVPTANPVGGGILYSQAGALKWRGTSGTVTTIAPA